MGKCVDFSWESQESRKRRKQLLQEEQVEEGKNISPEGKYRHGQDYGGK